MKRNMDLVREILIFAEEEDELIFRGESSLNFRSNINLKDTKKYFDYEIIWEHVHVMAQGGLLKERDTTRNGDVLTVYRLTWQGHEFLESIRDQSTWDKLKELSEKHGSGLSIDLIREGAILLLRSAVS